jgi:predicted DsbA family dithiol-disulfide isomerase
LGLIEVGCFVDKEVVEIDVWSDYNCPWCFLASAALEQLEGTHSVAVQWHAFELRPKGSPPIAPEYLARIEANKPRLYALAKEQYGLELQQGPFGIDSRPALIGAKFAEEQGTGHAYHRAVMRAYWLDAQDISQRTVLAELATGVGLAQEPFLAALDDNLYDEQVQSDIDQARQFGLNSVPALVFDQRYLISGAQPHPVLAQAVEQILAERSQEKAPG